MIGPYFSDFTTNNNSETQPASVEDINPAHSLNLVNLVNDSVVIEPPKVKNIWSLFLLKCVVVPTAALFTSLSLPLSIITIEKKFYPNVNSSIEQKLLQTLLPYLALLAFRTWFLWYRIGQRLDGKPDKLIETLSDTPTEGSMAVIACMIANISGFTNGLLLLFLALQKTDKVTTCIAGILLGSLSYTVDLNTDVADAFRKYAETEQAKGKHIHPFFKQKIIHCLFQSQTNNFGAFLREVLPITVGLIRLKSFTQVTQNLLANDVSQETLKLINFAFGPLVYQANAYYAKFDVIQLHDNLKACQLNNFDLDNKLITSKYKPVKDIAKIINGQLLMDAFLSLNLSVENSVNATFLFANLGFISLIITVIQSYLISPNEKAVQENKEGLLMTYYLGENTPLDKGPQILLGTLCTATLLGTIGLFSQTSTIKEYAKNRSLQIPPNQIAIVNTP